MFKSPFWQKSGLILLGIFTLFTCLPACGKTPAGAGTTVITSLQGDVQMQKKADNNWAKASAQMVLQPGDVIKTGTDGNAIVTFFEGTTIELKANTQIAVSELTKAPAKGGATMIRLKQQIGNTVNTVSKLTDAASRYEIETPSAVAGVRGSIMLVSVAQDGSTKVTNQEGHVYVNAQGVEVVIPVGNSSTVQPGQPPAPPQPAVNGNADPLGDIFDSQGKPVSGYQYLDIVNETTDYTNGTWTFTIKLNGNIPDTVEAPGVVEYDVMVDADNNIKTGWQSPLLFNDLGIDYYVYFSVAGSVRKASVIDTATSAPVNNLGVNYSSSGDTVKIWFKYDLAGAAKNYSYVVLARQYSKTGDPQSLVAADKLPNQGHLTSAPAATVSETTGDLFDYNGKPVTGEAYQDIAGSTLTRENGLWVWRLVLDGNVPTSMPSNIYMEWDLMVDSDNNTKTGWTSANLWNDIGVDYYFNVLLIDNKMAANDIITATSDTSNSKNLQFKVTGNVIELKFPPSAVGNAANFNYGVVTRKYDKSNATSSVLLGADKMPDAGHFTAGG